MPTLGLLAWTGTMMLLVLAMIFFARPGYEGFPYIHRDDLNQWNFPSLVGALIIVVVYIGGLFPYRWEYHSHQARDVNVIQVDYVLRDGSIHYLIHTQEDEYPLVCNDSRCQSLSYGWKATLMCTKRWAYAARDYFSCEVRSLSPPGSGETVASY